MKILSWGDEIPSYTPDFETVVVDNVMFTTDVDFLNKLNKTPCNYKKAIERCESIGEDWRLPTRDEVTKFFDFLVQDENNTLFKRLPYDLTLMSQGNSPYFLTSTVHEEFKPRICSFN